MQPPYKILLLDTKAKNTNHSICLTIRDGLQAMGAEVHYVHYDDAIRTATIAHCNVFLAFDGEEMHVDICRKLVALCDLSILWLTDDPYEAPGNLAASEMFDLVYSNDRDSVGRYGAKGRHLPFAGSKNLHYYDVLEESSDRFRYDVTFVGTAWPNRVKLLDSVLRELKGKRFKIALAPVGSNPLDLPILESTYLWRTSTAEVARLANRSRITLALHRDFTTNPEGVAMASTPPPRLFEAALAGSLQFYDAAVKETAEYFEPGKEIVAYDSPGDCIEKLWFYLSNPDLRYAIAKAAQLRALSEHTYESRAATILEEIKSAAAQKRFKRKAEVQRPRVLFLTHNIRPAGHFGGVEVYQEAIAEKLSAQYNIFFYYRDRNKGPNTYVLTDVDYRPLEEIRFDNEYVPATLSVPIKESAFATLLENYQINLVHCHHLVNHPASLILIAKMLHIPVILTLQDFWVMCDNHNLVDYRRQYCDIEHRPDAACDICVDSRLHKPAGTQAVRKAFFHRVLQNADIVIGNTEGYHRILSRFYPDIALSEKVRVLPLPLPDAKANSPLKLYAEERTAKSKRPLRVAVLGNFTFEKGADAVVYTVNQLRAAPIEFIVFGRLDPPYDQILPGMRFPNLTVHGEYHHADLPRLLKDIDIALHLSMWPETYCIALSEAWNNGLVPIVTDIGALGERVVDGENGWKVPPEHPAGLLALLRRLLALPELLSEVRKKAATYPCLYDNETQHVDKLKPIYDDLIDRYPRSEFDTQDEFPRSRLTLFEAGIVLNQNTWSQTFEAYRDATSVVNWSVTPHNRYVSPSQRAEEVITPLLGPSPRIQTTAPANNVGIDVDLQQFAVRVDSLERSIQQYQIQVQTVQKSRIRNTFSAARDFLFRPGSSGNSKD